MLFSITVLSCWFCRVLLLSITVLSCWFCWDCCGCCCCSQLPLSVAEVTSSVTKGSYDQDRNWWWAPWTLDRLESSASILTILERTQLNTPMCKLSWGDNKAALKLLSSAVRQSDPDELRQVLRPKKVYLGEEEENTTHRWFTLFKKIFLEGLLSLSH
jgi:hypothetical protein